MNKDRLEEIAKLSDSSNPAAFEIGDLWNAIDELLEYVEELEATIKEMEERIEGWRCDY